MKIKRFIADNISGAMAQVRAELGPDAVILSNQQREGQVEIVCAVDYDESRLDSAYPQSEAPPETAATVHSVPLPMAQSGATGKTLDQPEPLDPPGDSRTSPSVAAHSNGAKAAQQLVWASDPLLEDMHHTVESLRDLIEHQMLDMVWAGSAGHHKNASLAVRKLLEAGFSAETSRELLAHIPAGYSRERALQLALTLVKRKLPTPEESLLEQGGTIAVMGPPGAGKTTLAVGLAARYARQHGVSEVALVGFDNQRVGAQEQLRMYGQLLGMPVHIVQQSGSLRATLQGLQNKAMVVVDTAGYNGDDPALQIQLRQLMGLAAEALQTLLVLPAYGSSAFLRDAIRRYRISIPQRCALTHLDSVSQPGVAISCLFENQLQGELASFGPRIADDLRPFNAGQILARFANNFQQPDFPETHHQKEARHAG